jgi:hypothetical protein
MPRLNGDRVAGRRRHCGRSDGRKRHGGSAPARASHLVVAVVAPSIRSPACHGR